MTDENGKSICVICGNNQQKICIAGKVDSFGGMTITSCPDFYKGDKSIITLNEDSIRELIKEYYPEYLDTLTDVKIKAFMDWLFDDLTPWIRENWEAFNDKAAGEGIKQLMASVGDDNGK